MKNRRTRVMALVMILIVGLIAPASAISNNAAEICPEGDSGKIDTTGDPESETVTAPEGKLISEFCVEAGSEPSAAGVERVVIDPPLASVVISHTSGKDVSHYSLFYVDAPDEPEVDYCDPSQRPNGVSIADWLPEGFNQMSCFEWEVVPVLACGSYDAAVTGPYDGYKMVWVEGADQNTSLNGLDLPATFAEGYNGGSVDITVWIEGPEKDYLVDSGLPNYWDNNPHTFSIITDCLEPDPEIRVSFEKVWVGSAVRGVTVTFMLEAYGHGIEELAEGEWSSAFGSAADYRLVDEEYDGLPDNCTVTNTDITAGSATFTKNLASLVYTVTNTVDCEEGNGEPDTFDRTIRAVPTGIDSGTGGYLPSSTPTAALLLLMLGGLALTSGAAASLVRRRG